MDTHFLPHAALCSHALQRRRQDGPSPGLQEGTPFPTGRPARCPRLKGDTPSAGHSAGFGPGLAFGHFPSLLRVHSPSPRDHLVRAACIVCVPGPPALRGEAGAAHAAPGAPRRRLPGTRGAARRAGAGRAAMARRARR